MIGIIGGSGLENPEIFKHPEIKNIETPYGVPSSSVKLGEIEGVRIALLSRHGLHHEIPPTQVNNRANLFALKELGCGAIIATTACGSLREEINRGHFVVPDQFIDFTRHRKVTFYESFPKGEMKHTPMATPFNISLSEIIYDSGKCCGAEIHLGGTVVTIEGPRFSTKAESNMFRLWGGDLINMSTAPEVILANEIGLPYAAIAMATDYDCWKIDEEPVTWETVLDVFKSNVSMVVNIIRKTLSDNRIYTIVGK